jgi:hypothetical protein
MDSYNLSFKEKSLFMKLFLLLNKMIKLISRESELTLSLFMIVLLVTLVNVRKDVKNIQGHIRCIRTHSDKISVKDLVGSLISANSAKRFLRAG